MHLVCTLLICVHQTVLTCIWWAVNEDHHKAQVAIEAIAQRWGAPCHLRCCPSTPPLLTPHTTTEQSRALQNCYISNSKKFWSVRVAKTVFPANGGFVWVTPARFCHFVGFRALRSATPCFCRQNVNRQFRYFSSEPPVFGRVQKHRFPTTPFSQPWSATASVTAINSETIKVSTCNPEEPWLQTWLQSYRN